MAKIFIELSTGIGPLIRCLPIAVWLREQGHEVRYFARDNATKYMRELGFRHIDIDPERVPLNKVLNPHWRDIDSYWGGWGFNQVEWLSDRIDIWKSALTRYAPDVLVADFGVLTTMTARLLQLPLAHITQSCNHPGVFGGTQSFWLPDYRPDHRSRDCANRVFEKEGSAYRVERFEELFCGDRTIIPSIPEFDILESGQGQDVVFTGPILWDGLYSGAPSQWPSFEGDRPTVFVYTGRMKDGTGNSGELLLRAALDSARAGAFDLVISTGGIDELPADIRHDRSNVRVVEWIPVETAYRRSDLVIHHGGHGSCLAGLKYGVPALIVPTHTEREYNARLMKKIGCADMIPKTEVSGDLIVHKAANLLSGSLVSRELERYSRLIADKYSDAPQVAGETILSLV
jgi:UDP:flavonoid glycosyltransferase YjiC (YdhE family)